MKSNDKSYPILEGSMKTLQILRYIAKQAIPVTAKDIEEHFDIKYATVMTHLATMEKENYIERVGDGFLGTTELATFWAARRKLNRQIQKKLDKEYELIGREENND